MSRSKNDLPDPLILAAAGAGIAVLATGAALWQRRRHRANRGQEETIATDAPHWTLDKTSSRAMFGKSVLIKCIIGLIKPDKGSIETEVVVNAGGMFAGEIGRLAGVTVPIIPMAHEYLITRPSGIALDIPTMRDPSLLVYFRGESGGLVMGGYERNPAPWGLDGIPEDFNGKLLPEDWERFDELMTNAVVRVPELEDAEVISLVNGPEAFTPDGEFILGESDVRGFWVAAGFCAHGLAGAGGMGRLVAEWIVKGVPSLDVWEMDSRRFGPHYRSREYTLARTYEIYSTYYDIKYPGQERLAGRPLRLSPTYTRLQELGASFGEKSGWERANWFEPNAASGDESLRPRGWAGEIWSPAIGAEHRACREAAAVFDETSFAKIDVVGPGAADFLERMCDNRVARDVGAITYTQMLNPRGGIECDFTVTRLAEDRFRIVTGTAFGNHDAAWIRRHLPGDGSARVEDVTSRLACLGLWGPAARDILQPLTDADLSNDAFRYMRAQEIAVGTVPCLALRVTYVGELGWELYCPMEFGLRLFDTIWVSGKQHGLAAGGYKAIDSLRLEKGYRVWGADITPDETPYEAGLDFAVKLDKGDFIGRDALGEASKSPPERRLACLVLSDPRSVALGSEPVRVDGETLTLEATASTAGPAASSRKRDALRCASIASTVASFGPMSSGVPSSVATTRRKRPSSSITGILNINGEALPRTGFMTILWI